MMTKTAYIKMWPNFRILLWFFLVYILCILKNANLEKSEKKILVYHHKIPRTPKY